LRFSGGLGHIDIDDWKSHTRLKHCNPETQVVRWFWEILDEYSEEMRARLLQFVTGSSRVRIVSLKKFIVLIHCMRGDRFYSWFIQFY